jgi:hypothetical protein
VDFPWKRGTGARRRDVVIEQPEVLEVIEQPEVQAPAAVDEPGIESADDFDNLPVVELLGWLESHAPKDFLEVQLRQICEEVEMMQA